ncbi:MAG: cbb3-type cytochrome c oxidase subunit II [Myxococcota bacterium]
MERLGTILFVAGVGCFGLAVVVMGYLPVMHLSKIPYQSLAEAVPAPSLEWQDLAQRYPESFEKYYGKPTASSFHEALRRGRDIYIAEGCWHCHSQFVRPVSNEDIRFGKVSWAGNT